MKLIDLHYKWMKTGYIYGAGWGLCGCVPKKYMDSLDLFYPNNGKAFWASNKRADLFSYDVTNGYGILRQTIVLFICAMHNEL